MIVVGPFERLCLLEDLGDGMLGPKKGSLENVFHMAWFFQRKIQRFGPFLWITFVIISSNRSM